MKAPFYWTCPTCGAHTTITSPNHNRTTIGVFTQTTPVANGIELSIELIECPNTDCLAQNFEVQSRFAERTPTTSRGIFPGDPERPVGIGRFTFLPTTAYPLSAHVPTQVQNDYNEAFLIKDLSEKASATLARRALQGMVRDFFSIRDKKTLHQELEAIKDKCDTALYDAMMGVKSVGNIGAHPEQDVNLIVDVEPGEPEALLQLIHLLDREWYVARADRDARIAKMKALAAGKEAARNGGPPPSVHTA